MLGKEKEKEEEGGGEEEEEEEEEEDEEEDTKSSKRRGRKQMNKFNDPSRYTTPEINKQMKPMREGDPIPLH